MKIAILGAMSEEIDLFLKRFECQEIEFAKNKFYLTNYKNHELIIAYSKIGKVNSTLTASVMIEHFGAQSLIFVGVAGAIKPGLNIGDLVFGETLCQHDLDISAFGHPYGYVPGSEIYIKTDNRLNNIIKEVALDNAISIKPAVIASGDQFICDESKKSWIATTFNADIVEMEGASVAVACDALNVPFCVLRSISDTAGGGADIDFDKFLIEAANLSADFITKMIEKI